MVIPKSCCIVVLIGLPGCGKTKFCNTFIDYSKNLRTPGNKCVLHISYDTLMYSNTKTDLQTTDYTLEWNKKRTEIIDCVDWHLSETLQMGSTHDIPSGYIYNMFLKHVLTCNPSSMMDLDELIYIIDDNMFYESMRYKFYQLAKKYEIGYSQIYFDFNLSECLDGNKNREDTIPEQIIYDMNYKLEKPIVTEKWQKYTLLFNSKMSVFDMLSGAMLLIAKAASDYFKNEESFKLETTIQSQLVSYNNIWHQCDQILRKIVSEELSEKYGHFSKNEMKTYATNLHGYKKQTLHNLHKFEDELNILFGIENTSDQKSQLYFYIKNKFEELKSNE